MEFHPAKNKTYYGEMNIDVPWWEGLRAHLLFSSSPPSRRDADHIVGSCSACKVGEFVLHEYCSGHTHRATLNRYLRVGTMLYHGNDPKRDRLQKWVDVCMALTCFNLSTIFMIFGLQQHLQETEHQLLLPTFLYFVAP